MFDVNPAPDRNPHLETAILESGVHDRSIRLALEACEFSDILDAEARQVIRQTAERVSAGWRARRLMSIPGIGPIGATALAASVTDARHFRSGREFAAWLGLTPRQHSSGGKERLGRISKMGDKYLRTLLVVGMTSLIKGVKRKPEVADPRLVALLARKPGRVATVAMANHTARVAWAIMARGETYRAGHQPQAGGLMI